MYMQVIKLRRSFLTSPCVSSSCSPEVAHPLLDELCQELVVLKVQSTDLVELQELLETNVFNFSLIKR